MGDHDLMTCGERVLLRPLRESDVEESLRVWTPELRHMYGGSLTAERRPTMEDRRQWFARVTADESGRQFAIETDGHYIGHVGLRAIDHENRKASLAIGIESPHYWGRGYGAEVIRLMLRYAFETLNLHRVELRAAAYNLRAIRCYEKCGFRHEGIERDSFFVDGEWHDDLLMAILRQEWEAQRNPSPCQGEGRVRVAGRDAYPHLSPPPERGRRDASDVRLRSYRFTDYDQVAALWLAVGFDYRASDSREALAQRALRDPSLFLVAELGGRVIGTALGAWDGRRAFLNRVAVHPQYQRRRVGKRLLEEVEARLVALGADRIGLLTGAERPQACAFYESLGYEVIEGVTYLRKLVGADHET